MPALAAVRSHVADWPRDALVANTAANQTGLIGTSGRAGREQEQLDFLAALAPHYGDDWWFNGHYAMALSELGHQAAARPLIERSMAQKSTQRRRRACDGALPLRERRDRRRHRLPAFLAQGVSGARPLSRPFELAPSRSVIWSKATSRKACGSIPTRSPRKTYSGPALIKLLDAPSYLWRAELAGHPRDHARLAGSARIRTPRLPAPRNVLCGLACGADRCRHRRHHGRRSTGAGDG